MDSKLEKIALFRYRVISQIIETTSVRASSDEDLMCGINRLIGRESDLMDGYAGGWDGMETTVVGAGVFRIIRSDDNCSSPKIQGTGGETA